MKPIPALPFISAIASVGFAIGILEAIGATVNGATAAQILLLVVLLDARFCGTGPALVAGLLATMWLLRYFVMPTGFAFGDPNDVAALVAFIVMAVVGGELALRAERRARESQHLYEQLQAAFERESQAEAARRNERVKATLLDAMAHNLRTPLTGIKVGVTALLAAEHNDDVQLSRLERLELLDVIDQESDRLNRFIGGLATELPIDSSLLHPMTARAVRVTDLVAAALTRATTLVRNHVVVVTCQEELAVAVDRSSMVEVLYILLDNASKYAPPRTRITITVAHADERHVILRVEDGGPGISPEFRERVFDRFFRIPNRESHDPRRSGAGIGLSLAKVLVETQGGRIWIDAPTSGQGTAVVVMLPVNVPSLVQPALSSRTPQPLG